MFHIHIAFELFNTLHSDLPFFFDSEMEKNLILLPLKQYFLIMQIVVSLALSDCSSVNSGAINLDLFILIIN